jgi:hypothetical protein
VPDKYGRETPKEVEVSKDKAKELVKPTAISPTVFDQKVVTFIGKDNKAYTSAEWSSKM